MSEFEKELEKNMKLNKVAYERESIYSDFLVSKRDIERIFHDWQPPKPREIPVEIPQLVAVWFEDRMLGSFSAVVASYSFNDDEAITWVHDNGGLDLLCKMKLYGYTVEKEQLYEVVINGLYLAKLMKCDDSKSHSFIEKDELVNWQETGYRLTAKQIKMIDERYLKFAVKVDEV